MAGILGTVVLTALMVLLSVAGLPLRFELMIGSYFTGEIDFDSWLLGFVIQLLFGGLLAIAYGLIFEHVLRRAGALGGLAVGAIHVALAGIAMDFASVVHPLVPHATLPAPEYFGTGLGLLGTLSFIGLHLIYALVVGLAYGSTAAQEAPSAPSETF
jgi:hypothetical protein